MLAAEAQSDKLCVCMCVHSISLSSQHSLPQELLRWFYTASFSLHYEILQPNLPSSHGSLVPWTSWWICHARSWGLSGSTGSLFHMEVVDLKAARTLSAMDLSCGPVLFEVLCLPLALCRCMTQVTQSSGTSLLIPGLLCEKESLCDSGGEH